MDYRINVSCGCTGKILKTIYFDYLDYKEYNSTSVQCRMLTVKHTLAVVI